MKRIVALLLTVVYLSALAGCGTTGENTGNTRIITDGADRQVEVPEKVESIVCVGVGALRYTCYVGAQDLVVGDSFGLPFPLFHFHASEPSVKFSA